MKRAGWILAAVSLLALVGWDFVAATTFLGDDYIFRAYAQLEANPWAAFVSDRHGGEYYRPMPMLLWWILERLSGGQAWAFALAAFLLHLCCAVCLGLFCRAMGFAPRTAGLAGLLFFIAPAEREAALWFSASTDLLAASAMLGALVGFLSASRWGRPGSWLLAGLAFFSKETALILPGLLMLAGWQRAQNRGEPRRPWLLASLPHWGLALLYLVARFHVLHGLGGTNNPSAPWWAWGIQWLSGLVHATTAYAPLPEWLAWLAGGAVIAVGGVVAWHHDRRARFAVFWLLVTLAPLPAAGWVVGARYFYLPAAGLMVLLALALEAAQAPAAIFTLLCFLGLGLLSGQHRASEVRQYRELVATTHAALTDGLARGHRLFFVRGGVKDLDLALKLGPGRPREPRDFVVIVDVPASFLWLPQSMAGRLDFLLARPPLPPSGAYRFGGERIAGQARRAEAPDLEEVLARLPDLRIIQLTAKGSRFAWQDRTLDYAQE
jgi:hypothetical protein